jgi:hypothetical protein
MGERMNIENMMLPGGVAAALFILGLFRNSRGYLAVRDALGVASYNLGKAASAAGNSKLKGIYEPIEAVIVDWFLFMAEQMAAGMRNDNPEKLKTHIRRLDGVGSETRKAAVGAKLEEVKLAAATCDVPPEFGRPAEPAK